jgi:uncharacterized membrane protein
MRKLVTIIAITAALVVTAMLAAPPETAKTHPSRTGEYVFGRNAFIDHPVHGDVQVYGGSATIRNVVDGDLLVFFGDAARFEGQGRVNGDVILFFSTSKLENANGRIGGRLYAPGSVEGAAAMITHTAVIISLLFVWLVVAIVVTLMSGREIRLSSVEIRTSPLHCLALGLVAVTSFVLTAIVFTYLIPYLIGVPLLAALGVFAILAKVYGTIAVFHAVGTMVVGSRTRDQLSRRRWLRGDLAMVVVGVAILGAVRLIPVVGTLIWASGSVFGIGVALATKFGRREPWFLVWRPVEGT